MLFGFDDTAASDERATDSTEPITPPSTDEASTRRWPLVLVGVLAGLAIGLAAWALIARGDQALTQTDVDQAVADALAEADTTGLSAGEAFDQIAPSLVIVRASGSDPDDPPNIGTGIVINERGQVMTADHVITDAIRLELGFSDGTTTTAEIESQNPALDIAVLNPLGGGVRVPAVLGNPRSVAIGDTVYAVGNPLGLTASLTGGVVSGVDRDIPTPFDDDSVFEGLIQFDAAVNQGSSGGPLLNADGQVIGIVTALADPAGEGFFVGIGFAVPIDAAAVGAADGPSQ